MNMTHTCQSPPDVGYLNVCRICGVPADAGYFDAAGIKAAPENIGEEVEVARHELHPQYCGTLLYFMQYAELARTRRQVFSKTPGYEWAILCNNQPRDPYLPIDLILNPWGYNALPIHLRLEEGCTLRFVVRRTASTVPQKLAQVGGRLLGRTWYNTQYGGVPNRL
jgi:hypothetical protein